MIKYSLFCIRISAVFLLMVINVSCNKESNDISIESTDFVGMWDAVNYNGQNLHSRKISYWFKSDGSCEIEDNVQSSLIMEGRWLFSEQDKRITVISNNYQYNATLSILWYSKYTNRFKAMVKCSGEESEIIYLRTLIKKPIT